MNQTVPMDLLPATTLVNESSAKKMMLLLLFSSSACFLETALLEHKWIWFSCLTFKLYPENYSHEPNQSLHFSQIQILSRWKQHSMESRWAMNSSNIYQQIQWPLFIKQRSFNQFKMIFYIWRVSKLCIKKLHHIIEALKKTTSHYLLTNSKLSMATHMVDLKWKISTWRIRMWKRSRIGGQMSGTLKCE